MRAAPLLMHVVAVLAILLTASIDGAPPSGEYTFQYDEPLIVQQPSQPAPPQAQQQPQQAQQQEINTKEAYFDGNALLRLRTFVSVHRHSGLSFRTCEPGKLFEQRYDTGDAIGLLVDQEGLVFYAKLLQQPKRIEARLNARLLDNEWHTVNMFFKLGNLSLSAVGHAQVVANAWYNSEILSLPQHNVNGTLIVGDGFRGCILQGPNILFNDSSNSNAVFGPCPETKACGPSGLTMTSTPASAALTPTPAFNWCQHEPCMSHGKCVNKPDRYECHCYARWSGANCQTDNGSPCLSNPCRHGGSCLEDSNGDYTCKCFQGFVGQRCEAIAGTRLCDTANPCKYDSKCVELPDGDYRCDCRLGFTGRNCEINIDECASSPCKNHGNCTDAVNGYICKCDRTGYSGTNCELDIDECSNGNPCLNGNCHNNYGGYICECQEGFEGQNCEFNINECLSSPCKNGGQCVDEVGTYHCNCSATGYTGKYCEQPLGTVRSLGGGAPPGCESTGCPVNSVCLKDQCVCKPGYIGTPFNCTQDFCATKPCDNGGTCTNFRDKFECVCPPEWKGPTCKTPDLPHWCPICANGGSCIDTIRGAMCACPRFWSGPQCKEPVTCRTHRPCKRSTECRDYPMGYFCVCEPGWTGPECGHDIDECVSDPCRNGGICIDQLDNYYCQCLSGYAGKNCQINVNECQSQPCQHGGTCTDHPNGYICTCTMYYEGKNCEHEYNACVSKPCRNNGTCVLTANSKRDFVCECPTGFEGKTCDTNVDECVGVVCPDEKVCVDGVGEFSCKCREGYKEPNCTLIIDPCANKSCGNGTCKESGEEDYKCECHTGYAGKFCDQDINECEAAGKSLCVNGICVNKPGSYECYCKPGYSGSHCDVDINECLCGPCKNNATCIDRINTFECKCPPGYTGKTCEEDINECEGDPCQNGATCLDEIARYTCMCLPGFTGPNCETNIDDCEPQPCLNHGQCLDGVNSYSCNCTDTGFEGEHCEFNIDDCEINPCENNATCIDKVKNYTCECWPGYTGKNCEIDIDECDPNPCQYNGTCYERSVQGLYTDRVNKTQLPAALQNATFSYATASGYECACPDGTKGKDCEININECESNPCFEGTCIDHLGNYSCECNPGFQGDDCREEIDECKLYNPCKHGYCSDRKADYFCHCDAFYGGKNCTVPLKGCEGNACKNNGTCIPYLVNESEHKFNCTCPNGFHGEICDHITTISLNEKSLVTVNTSRDEGYDIQFRFRTTLPDGLLAMGKGPTYYMLELIGGKLNFHSSILNKWDGVFVGSDLNDSNWQKVFVAINTTHLVLSAKEEQTIYPINLNEGTNSSYTSFTTTYIGSTVNNLKSLLYGQSYFIGCTEDVIVNGEWIYKDSGAEHIAMEEVAAGCPRENQCLPNPCRNNGHCTDRWSNFSCRCERPYLGDKCQYNMTAVTFGYENITDGYVTVKVIDTARRALRSVVDISMFIRSREEFGDIFYLGSEPTSLNQTDAKEGTFISAHLERGELLVKIHFNGTEGYTVGGVKLNDGNYHMIQVIRNITLVQVKINGTEYFRKTISASGQLNVTVLYLGGQPQMTRFTRQVEAPPAQRYFKGIIQDVQVSNGSNTMVVEFYPLKAEDIPKLLPFGNVTFNREKVLEGVVSDNVCSSNPCYHNGTCHVTWNDFWCQCPRGYTGKTCQEMEFCQLQDCPTGSKCQNLDDGYECMANATFDGIGTSFNYIYRHQGLYNGLNQANITDAEIDPESTIDKIKITYRSNTGGTLMHIAPKSGNAHFTVSVQQDQITVTWKLHHNHEGILTFGKAKPDGNWTTVLIKLNNDSIECSHEEAGDDIAYQTSQNFNFRAWYDLLLTGTVTLGGLGESLSNRDSYRTFGTDRHIDSRDGLIGNSVDFMEQKLTTNAPPQQMLSGEAFKGCLGEVRVGNMLLHYFTYEEVYQNAKFTPLEYLALQQDNTTSHEEIGCRLCFENNCQNGGHCLDQLNSYVCECPAGFAEEDCSVDINECENNKCTHNSTCIDGIANYTCACQEGWQGWLCEEDVDECVTLKPCLNDGICVNHPGYFHCECKEQYIGDLCETFKQITCADQPCRNGSTCDDTVNPNTSDNFTCTCMPGYEGSLCDTPYCNLRKCQNDGVCVYENQVPNCECPPGFKGQFCETNINDCAADSDGNVPCEHDGQCHDGINSFTCDCSGTGYTGHNCSKDINECLDPSYDCSGNGKCENLPGTYRCICNESFCGYNCNMVNPCIGNDYCKNGGTCECVEDTGYKCICAPGYGGQDCSESNLFGSSPMSWAIIVGPILGILFLIAGGSLIAFFMMARKKRATRGTYSPSAQEFSNPRVEMDNVMKPPPEERLI